MLRRTIALFSRVSPVSLLRSEAGSLLFNKTYKPALSAMWQTSSYESRSLTLTTRFAFASQPRHNKMAMPALSPTMEQGNLVKWNKKEGDKVEPGDQICDIETDKATLGFEMQDAGYIAKILVPEGTKNVKVGTPIVILVDNQADVQSFANYTAEAPGQGAASPEPKGVAAPTPQGATNAQEAQKGIQGTKPLSKGYEADHHHSENYKGVPRKNVLIRFSHHRGGEVEEHHAQQTGERVLASPFARKLAAEKGIDLSQLSGSGSGPNGRILAHDVQSYTPKAAPVQTVEKAAPTAAPSKEKAAAPKPVAGVSNPYTDIPLTTVREIIAKRLLQSKTTIPHYYLKMDIVMDQAIAIREQLNKDAKSKISFNDMFVKAAALACIDVPQVNSQWHGDFVRTFKNADVSIAVDTGNGLITPIVFAANTKGLSQIAATTKQLVEKAKSNTLKPQEFQGGTFSISNLGMFGTSRFAAVINPPQSCILAVGKTGKKVVPDGEGFKEVSVMDVVLSCDHRVVDGAVGAKWLQAFKNYLEKPHTMLL